jgi:hypothetical protein
MVKTLSVATISVLLLVVPRTDAPDNASLGGRIADEKGAPIAGARITARNKFSGEFEVSKSDSAGLYRIAQLKQGRYSVYAQAVGYGCTWVLNVLLFRGNHTTLDLVLTDSRKKESSANCTKVPRSAP